VEWVETTGRTIEEAKDAALDQLGVDESEAEFEIIEEPRTGLFGRVRGEGRIRARVRPQRPRPKTERRDRGRRSREAKPEGAKTSGERSGRSSRGGGRKPADAGAKDKDAAAAKDTDKVKEPRPSSASSGGRSGSGSSGRSAGRRRPGGGSGREHSTAPADAEVDRTEVEANRSTAVAAEGREMTDDDVTVEQQADLTEEFLTGLLDAFGVSGSLERETVDEDTIEVQVAGDDLGLLIGPKGQTLLAVQDMARTFVQRKATGLHQGRVRIDVGGYRQRRREALQRFARQVATEVEASGVQKALEPMAAGDRKVVHDEVNLIEGVRTISEGEDPRRRVVIIPE
jgi:spoIIIJ-associated protein